MGPVLLTNIPDTVNIKDSGYQDIEKHKNIRLIYTQPRQWYMQ